jgi:hypothetical protein
MLIAKEAGNLRLVMLEIALKSKKKILQLRKRRLLSKS